MPPENTVGAGSVSILRQDITLFECDAFVYYAQPDLALGTGFGNAIAIRGGPGIQKELDEIGAQETCACVLSSAGNLAATYIIHAVGPRFQEPDVEPKLRTTIKNALALADEKKIEKLGMPAMGRGFYGVPLPDSARITVSAVQEYLKGTTGIREVVICVNDHNEVDAFQSQLK